MSASFLVKLPVVVRWFQWRFPWEDLTCFSPRACWCLRVELVSPQTVSVQVQSRVMLTMFPMVGGITMISDDWCNGTSPFKLSERLLQNIQRSGVHVVMALKKMDDIALGVSARGIDSHRKTKFSWDHLHLSGWINWVSGSRSYIGWKLVTMLFSKGTPMAEIVPSCTSRPKAHLKDTSPVLPVLSPSDAFNRKRQICGRPRLTRTGMKSAVPLDKNLIGAH